MSVDRALAPVGLGLRAIKGGCVAVAVAIEGGKPRVLLSSFLVTAAEGDRLSLEPYHVAAGMERGPHGGASAEAAAAAAEGRRRQDRLAAAGLKNIVDRLREMGSQPVVAALLVNRAGWVTDLLEYSLAWPDHPPVAEGLAVRDALRFALGQCEIGVVEVDEKALPEVAWKGLGLAPGDLDTRLKQLGTAAGKPWRKEQKMACLAAWNALSARL